MNRFQFVDDHHRAFGVKRLCQVLSVNRSSYYTWRKGAQARAAREAADQAPAQEIRVVHAGSDGAYGSPRVTAELRADGQKINEKRVVRVMRKFAITGTRLRRRVRTTVCEPSATPVPDLFGRDFTVGAPGLKYMGSGSRRESHPPAPTEPCVIVSHYTALAILVTRNCGTSASERTSLGIAA
ncbi:IS3 family transposase [Acrocarpospora catenulata]|uniref:IS3 family transposase n=1 Tax=Acrocarpospora catenulata TaxID=2836182 RepID=UPI001BD99C2C|nr:IS3 family transposase [Acrocarpospora catenulata]